jgi:hypothetical protein
MVRIPKLQSFGLLNDAKHSRRINAFVNCDWILTR